MEQVEFLESSEPVEVKPILTSDGDFSGWAVYRGGKSLQRNRGGVRAFKTLCSIAKLCADNGIKSFEVKGL